MNRQKIRIEIIPEDDIDINKLRKRIHELISLNRDGCKTIRSWTEKLKTCDSAHISGNKFLSDNHNCMLVEGHKENHRCECGFTWDNILYHDKK